MSLEGTLDSLDSDATALLAPLAYDLVMEGCATQKPQRCDRGIMGNFEAKVAKAIPKCSNIFQVCNLFGLFSPPKTYQKTNGRFFTCLEDPGKTRYNMRFIFHQCHVDPRTKKKASDAPIPVF